MFVVQENLIFLQNPTTAFWNVLGVIFMCKTKMARLGDAAILKNAKHHTSETVVPMALFV